jgi:hypothetical protein
LENVGIFSVPLEYLTDIWYILWLFGNFVSFNPFLGSLCQVKSSNPAGPEAGSLSFKSFQTALQKL